MSVKAEIQAKPVDLDALRAKSAPDELVADGFFTNFVYYAKHHWQYVASGSPGGEALLNGSTTLATCGGLQKALILLLREEFTKEEVEPEKIPSYVWTKPEYTCFDSRITGNLRGLRDRNYRNGTIFNQHYYLRWRTKYYDPCLSSAYRVKNACAKVLFGSGLGHQAGLGNGKLLRTPDRKTLVLFMPNESPPGFRGAWCMFGATLKNLQEAMGKKVLAAELKARGSDGLNMIVRDLR